MAKGGVKGHRVNPKSLENLQRQSSTPLAAEVEEKALRIIKLIREGKSKYQIQEELNDSFSSPSALARSYKKAYEILHAESAALSKNIAVIQFERLEHLYQKAMEEKKYSLALDVLKEVNKMCGTAIQNVIQVVNATDDNGKPKMTIQIIKNEDE